MMRGYFVRCKLCKSFRTGPSTALVSRLCECDVRFIYLDWF